MAGTPIVGTPGARRWLQPTAQSDVRVTWHDENDTVVLSLWKGEVCVAAAPLSVRETASLTTFLVAHLGRRAGEHRTLDGPIMRGPRWPRPRLLTFMARLGLASRTDPARGEATDRLRLVSPPRSESRRPPP